MPWTTPKTDWDTNPTNPLPSDFNRIEGNIDFLNIDIETKKGLIVNALSSVGIAALIADTHVQLASKITSSKKTGISITPGTANQEIPKGIYDTGGGVVVGDANLIGINIKPGVSIFGVAGAIPSKGAATITPGTTNQVISAGQYLTGDQTVAGDADLISANIKAGANIFGVAGNSNVVDTSAGDATAAQMLSGKKAYVDGVLVTGTIPSKIAATIIPAATNQTIAAGQYLSGAQTIAGSINLVPGNIKDGANIFGVVGTVKERLTFDIPNIHMYMDDYNSAVIQNTTLDDVTLTSGVPVNVNFFMFHCGGPFSSSSTTITSTEPIYYRLGSGAWASTTNVTLTGAAEILIFNQNRATVTVKSNNYSASLYPIIA
jgi:hypothetical protein